LFSKDLYLHEFDLHKFWERERPLLYNTFINQNCNKKIKYLLLFEKTLYIPYVFMWMMIQHNIIIWLATTENTTVQQKKQN